MLHLQHKDSFFDMLRMQETRMQEMHERLSVFKECVLGMRSQHQDGAWWHEERRRDILVQPRLDASSEL